jgi:hypothetical protein
MPQVSGDRFSSFNMADCAFCPEHGRRFRTGRLCAQCSKPLCIVCRPWIPQQPYLCPECGGGPAEDALHAPQAAIARIEASGQTAPFWLKVLEARTAQKHEDPDEIVVPE